MPIRLLVKSKAETGGEPQEIVLNEETVTVGRDKSCNVVLNQPVISRRHFSIVREGALYFLEDLGSSFGTRINGAPLPAGEKRLLRNGDVIAAGPFDVSFDRIADVAAAGGAEEKTSFVAKRVVKDALRNLSSGDGPTLRVMNGPFEGKRFELTPGKALVLGREPGVDVLLDDDLVSRRHATIRRDWTGTYVEDLGSRNGVRVNRKRIDSHALRDRDEIEVGSTRFLYLDPTEVREAPVLPEEPPARVPVERKEPPKPEPKAAAAPPPEPEPEEPDPVEEQAPEDEAVDEEPEEEPEEDEAPEEEPEDEDEVSMVPPGSFAPREPEAEAGAAAGGWKDTLADGRWKSLLPVLVVVGVAIFAIAILAVTFFVL